LNLAALELEGSVNRVKRGRKREIDLRGSRIESDYGVLRAERRSENEDAECNRENRRSAPQRRQ
jgi:hypothetical protein